MNLTTQDVALLLSALGLGAVLNSIVKAVSDRRKLGADTTSILTSAARELVEPLRKELATEREERATEHRQHIEDLAYEKEVRRREHEAHLRELAQEREQAAELRTELDGALGECRNLRDELSAARTEIDALRHEVNAAARHDEG